MAGAETPSLYKYMQTCQRFLRDQGQVWINPDDLTEYINRARREVAMRTQSIRILTPVQGSITTIEVVHPGRGYIHPTVRISFPDAPSGEAPCPGGRPAHATAYQLNGRITNVSVDDAGDGYWQPQVWIEDEGWSFNDIPPEDRAVVRAHVTPLLQTQGFQEIYSFKAVPLDRHVGVAEVFAVKSISFIYMNYRYSIPVFPFSVYQAYVRIYPQQYLYVPTAAAQFGQGTNGTLYMYPIPSTMYQMEWDCFCLPDDLENDQDFEAIPKPWTDAVPYFATHLAYLELQNLNASQYWMQLYDEMVHRYSAYARPGRAINPYGRWAAFT